MTHHIKHPQNWPQLDALHTYLWRRFPLDRFDFIESSGEYAPVYSGTSLPPQPVFLALRGEQPKVGFFDDVSDALQEFLREGDRAFESDQLRENASHLKIA